jgi:hypothetical protein
MKQRRSAQTNREPVVNKTTMERKKTQKRPSQTAISNEGLGTKRNTSTRALYSTTKVISIDVGVDSIPSCSSFLPDSGTPVLFAATVGSTHPSVPATALRANTRCGYSWPDRGLGQFIFDFCGFWTNHGGLRSCDRSAWGSGLRCLVFCNVPRVLDSAAEV